MIEWWETPVIAAPVIATFTDSLLRIYCRLSGTRQLLLLSPSCFKQLLPENLTEKFHYYLCRFASHFILLVFCTEGYGKCALRKEPVIAPFVERFKIVTLRMSDWEILLALTLAFHFFPLSTDRRLWKCALQKTPVIAPFIKRFKTATLRKSYW